MNMETDNGVEYPIFKDGTVINSANLWDFTCYICPESTKDLLPAHLNDGNHILRLNNYTHFFSNDGPRVYCRFCPDSIDVSEVIDHAESHELIPWYVPEEASEILFKNFISNGEYQYFCHLCKVKLPFWFLVEPHNRDINHQALRRTMIEETTLDDPSLSSAYYKLVTKNSIFMKTLDTLTCYLCDCPVGKSYELILDHIQKGSHAKREKAHLEVMKSVKICGLQRQHCSAPNDSLNSGYVEVKPNSSSVEEDIQIESFDGICHDANDTIIEPHLLDQRCKQKEKRDNTGINFSNHGINNSETSNNHRITPKIDKNEGPESSSLENVQQSPYCSISTMENRKEITSMVSSSTCQEENAQTRELSTSPNTHLVDESINKANIDLEDRNNSKELPEGMTWISENVFYCGICKCNVLRYSNIVAHVKGKAHLRRQQKPSLKEHIVERPLTRHQQKMQWNIQQCKSFCSTTSVASSDKPEILENRQSHQEIICDGSEKEDICSKVSSEQTSSSATGMNNKIFEKASNVSEAEVRDAQKSTCESGKTSKIFGQVLPKEILRFEDEVYICMLCKCHLPAESMETHLQDPQHKTNILSLSGTASVSRSAKDFSPKLIINSRGKRHFCVICHRQMSKLDISMHISGSKHKKNISTIMNGIRHSVEKVDTNINSKQDKPENEIPVSVINQKNQLFPEITEIAGTNLISCEICYNGRFIVTNGINGHLNGRTHRTILAVRLANLPKGVVSTEIDNLFWCRSCDSTMKGFCNVQIHCKSQKHKTNSPHSLMIPKNNDPQNVDLLKNEETAGEVKSNETDMTFIVPYVGLKERRNSRYKCSLCNTKPLDKDAVLQHVNGKRHIKRLIRHSHRRKIKRL